MPCAIEAFTPAHFDLEVLTSIEGRVDSSTGPMMQKHPRFFAKPSSWPVLYYTVLYLRSGVFAPELLLYMMKENVRVSVSPCLCVCVCVCM